MTQSLSVIACIILTALSLFQLSLAHGAPLGKYAWGGKYSVLPTKLRIASLLSIFIYGIFAAFIVSASGLFHLIGNMHLVRGGMWAFTVYFFIGILMNGISRSKLERNVMTPSVCIFAVLFLLVAKSYAR